jgi:hypothetical protein
MTTRDNEPYPENRVDPVDDNRLADDNRPLDEDPRLTDDRATDDRLADDRLAGDERGPADDRVAEGDRLDADRGWQDEPTAATDRTADADASVDSSADASRAGTAASSDSGLSADEPLVPTDASVDFKARWDVIQQGFVDDPRAAVTDADKLVSDVLQRLSERFDQQHQGLESQWANGEPSTEDLRSALQRYRAFFERLLTL